MSANNPPASPSRLLTKDEVRAELARIRLGARDPLGDAVAGHAARSGADPRELFNEAVKRALTTRGIPAGIPFEAVLAEIARSIASGWNVSRARARQSVFDLPVGDIVDLIPAGGYTVASPEDIIEQDRIRQLCADALAQLARDEPRIEALVDGIGQGLRGDELMSALGITKRELATMRKALKRSAKRIWPTVQQQIER